MNNNVKTNVLELEDTRLNKHEFIYNVVVFGRDLSSYLIAFILKQHGYQVAIVSRPEAPVMTDLCEYICLKYLFEAAQRIRSIQSLNTKGLQIEFDKITSDLNWQKLTNECKQEFFNTKQKLEKEIIEKDIPIHEGSIVMVEDHILRVVSEDESVQIASLRTDYVIIGSDICRSTIKNDFSTITTSHTLKRLRDIIDLNQMPKNLTVIGGGDELGISVASCLKELGCAHVAIIEQQSHCLMDINDIDRELAAYIESILIKQEIEIFTKCSVNYLTAETVVHSTSEPIETDYRFIALGTKRKLNSIQNTPTISIIQLIEKVSFGRQIHIGTTVVDEKGKTTVVPVTQIIPIDYQRVKSFCSIEQGISVAYRTICKCLSSPKPTFFMPSFIYTIPPLLIIGQTHTPADNMFICHISVPPTFKYAIDTLPRGFGKFWISRTRKVLCGVQFLSEHAAMFGKAFGILIRNQLSLDDICNRIELPGSIGEAVQLMIKQALAQIINMTTNIKRT